MAFLNVLSILCYSFQRFLKKRFKQRYRLTGTKRTHLKSTLLLALLPFSFSLADSSLTTSKMSPTSRQTRQPFKNRQPLKNKPGSLRSWCFIFISYKKVHWRHAFRLKKEQPWKPWRTRSKTIYFLFMLRISTLVKQKKRISIHLGQLIGLLYLVNGMNVVNLLNYLSLIHRLLALSDPLYSIFVYFPIMFFKDAHSKCSLKVRLRWCLFLL